MLRNDQFQFSRRTRRPPRDEVNSLLSFGYAVLGSIVETELYRCGLDPLLGFFHQPAYGRASLMLDFLEEFRPSVDTLVLRVLNRRQLSPGDFEQRTSRELAELLDVQPPAEYEAELLSEETRILNDVIVPDATSSVVVNGPAESETGVYLGDVGRKIFLNELFRRLRERLYYPPLAARLELRDIIRQQIYLLARVIEGKTEAYHPVDWD